MSKSSESNNDKFQPIKYCENGKIEEGRIGGVKVRETLNINDNGNMKKMKWPTLCDANPYIVDLWKNLFKKKEKSETVTSETASSVTASPETASSETASSETASSETASSTN